MFHIYHTHICIPYMYDRYTYLLIMHPAVGRFLQGAPMRFRRPTAARPRLAREAAASRPKKRDDEQAAWRLERATLETLAKARERAHAEKVKEMLADSLKAQSALEAAKDEVIESLTTELEETKRELRTETQKGCELEAAPRGGGCQRR